MASLEYLEIVAKRAFQGATRGERRSRRLGAGLEVFDFSVDISDGRTISWLYGHGEIIERLDDDHFAHLKVRLDARDRARFESLRHAPVY